MTDSGVSMHIAQLRKELGDPLYSRGPSGLVFTPGGLCLAGRSAEILGLQRQTAIEVGQAGHGRRMLRIAASPLFAEHAAPGLVDLFASAATNLSVEVSVHPVRRFADLVASRAVDVALGPRAPDKRGQLSVCPFLHYEVLTVCAADHPLAHTSPPLSRLREQQWFLGPSAAAGDGPMRHMLRGLGIPDSHKRVFPSDASAIEAVRQSTALTVALRYAVGDELFDGTLGVVDGPDLRADGDWCATTLARRHLQPATTELLHIITTPHCRQAMTRSAGADITHYTPHTHVVRWN